MTKSRLASFKLRAKFLKAMRDRAMLTPEEIQQDEEY